MNDISYYNYSPSAKPTKPYEYGMKVFVVPGWVLRAVYRNKFSAIDLMDYTKMRSILSVDDMAEWFYLNDMFQVEGKRLGFNFLDNYSHSISPVQKTEINNSVLPLSGSEEVAISANAKLDKVTSLTSTSEYEFIKLDNLLYVVLNEGFNKIVQDHESKMIFVNKYLKECYAMTSVSEVSRFSIFELYLMNLSK